jgi:NAD(P)-dependent dehydrogenase (short-subunit alcohol dehydrogenase family)
MTIRNELTPTNRVAIVTGAARGIGAAVAVRLAGEGLAIALIDVSDDACAATVETIAAGGGTAIAVAADVSDEAAVTAATEETVSRLGRPTVLVNNAGIATAADLVDMTNDQWNSVMGVNVQGPFFLTRAVVPHMIQEGWGRIVNMSSISALGDEGRVSYSSSKAALIGFTKTLAVELGPHGITVNAIAPGFIVSDMTRATAARLGRDFHTHQQLAAGNIPVGRVGRPEDIAFTAAYLVNPEAGFVSGQVIFVAGGPVS